MGVIMLPMLRKIWWLVAIISALSIGLLQTGGAIQHFINIFALSGAWLIGNEAVRKAPKLPELSIGFGLSCLAIGLIFARIPLTDDFRDPFRLLSFALFSAPLIVAIIQRTNSDANHYALRICAAVIGLLLLWRHSDALLTTKLVLTGTGILASTLPVSIYEGILSSFRSLYRPLVWTGSISYALYALHLPILFLCKYWITSTPLSAAAYICSSLFLAYVFEGLLQPKRSKFLRVRLLAASDTLAPVKIQK